MKLFALLCVIGLAAASSYGELNWESGQEYVFEYKGRMLTGIPELSSQYSGLGIKCTVHLQAQSSQKFAMKITEARYSKVNNVLHAGKTHGSSGNYEDFSWRNLQLPTFEPIPEESATFLSMNTLFTVSEGGSVEHVVVSKDEPEWSINFKKALVGIFQTQTSQGSGLESNTIEGVSGESSPSTWTTSEESIDGRCTVTYTIHEIAPYMVKDVPDLISEKRGTGSSSCTEGRTWELVKAKDVASCSTRSSFGFYKPGRFQCATGNCEGMWSRSSNTRYIACGERDNLQIQTIINDGELKQQLMMFKTEDFLTGTNQVLKLVSKQPISTRYQEPQDAVTVDNLMYEFVFKQNLIRSHGSRTPLSKLGGGSSSSFWENEELREELHKLIPHQIMISGAESNPLTGGSVDGKLIPQMKNLIKEIIRVDLKTLVGLPQKMVTMKLLNFARSLSICSEESIKSFYNEMLSEFTSGEDKVMFKNVFFDTLLMGGSATNMRLIVEYIEKNEVPSSQVYYILMFMPQYVMIPTQQVLEKLYSLVTMPKIVSQENGLFEVATLGFSQLLENACIAENRHTSYPAFIYGSFCEPNSDIVVEKWIPYLSKLVREESDVVKKNTAIVALGKIGHKQVIPYLLPIVEGEQGNYAVEEKSTEVSLPRFLATYSLAKPGRMYPEMVVPVLLSVFMNQGEATEIRIAAFNSLMNIDPSMSVIHQIASTTWREKDDEVLKVVTSAFFTLSHQTSVVDSMHSTSSDLASKAALVYPLMKKTEGRFPTSATLFTSDYLTQLQAGFLSVKNWISSSDSFIPSTMYGKLIYYLDRFTFSPFEIGMTGMGTEQFIEVLKEAVTNPEERSTEERIREKLSSELKEVISKLNIETRESSSMKGALIMSFFENANMFSVFDGISKDVIREKIMPYLKNPSMLKEKLIGSGEINYQRVMDFAPSEFLIPSDMGLPIVMEIHMPVAISAKGTNSLSLSPLNPSFEIDIQTIMASQFTGWAGTICPFSRETLYTGVDMHAVVTVPSKIHLKLDLPAQKASVTMRPVSVSPLDVFHFHIRPFTSVQSYWNLEPMTFNASAKMMQSGTPMQMKKYQFGEMVGLNLESIITSESRFLDRRTVLDKMALFNWDPINMFRFIWANVAVTDTGVPSIRQHEYQMRYNPSGSSTKEIKWETSWSYVTKTLGESFKQHVVESREGGSSLLSMKIAKKSLSDDVHPRRMEKIRKVVERVGSLDSGNGFSVISSVTIQGARPRSFTYSATFVHGIKELTQKWKLMLENDTEDKKICAQGHIDLPMIPAWNVDEIRNSPLKFRYENTIGYGSSCQESTIVVSGTSQVSQKQKTYSRISPEAKELERLTRERTPLIHLSELANKVRQQAAMIDHVNFHTEYKNVGPEVFNFNQRVIDFFKGVWWPYLKKVEGNGPISSPNGSSDLKIKFHTERESFNVRLTNSAETIQWEDIRLPYPLTYVFPKVAGKSLTTSLVKSLSGKSVYPTCSLEGEWMKTFNNRTTQAKLDDCFHVMTADCGKEKNFAVLVRNLEQNRPDESAKELKVFLREKVDILLSPGQSHSRYSSNIRVTVNGEEVSTLTPERYVPIHDASSRVVAEMKVTVDGVIVLRATGYATLMFDGYKVKVEAASSTLKSKLCGLCGSFSNKISADLTGPSKCVYSKPELLVASYRVGSLPSKSCKPLSGKIAEELEKEESECAKYKIVPTKVTKAYKLHSGECTLHKNLIVESGEKVCFSKKPIVECGATCKPEGGYASKKVQFTCMERTRTAKHIIERIASGETIPELEGMETVFTQVQELPRSCSRIHGY